MFRSLKRSPRSPEGRLSPGDAVEHIADCKDCIAALESANEAIATRNVAAFPCRRT